MKVASTESTRQGFSLIEIMVAVTLLTVITVGLLAMFYHTQRAFRIGTSQVDVLEGGRAIMQLVTRELQEMYPSHIDGAPNFYALQSGPVITMNLPGGGQRDNVLQHVSFLSRRGDEWIGTSYRVDHNGRGAGTLYRAIVSTNLGLTLTQRNATPQSQVDEVTKLFMKVSALVTITNTRDTSFVFNRIADGIVHFQVTAYDELGRFYTNGSVRTDGYAFTNFVPVYLDVELGIIEPKAIKQFEARARVIRQARTYLEGQAYRTHLFKQRIPIRAHRSEYDLFAAQ